MVSCGLSPEEQKALESLESREVSLKVDLLSEKASKDFWYKEFKKESNTNLARYCFSEYEIANNNIQRIQSDLAEVQFQISQIK